MPNDLPCISALLPSRNGERHLSRLVSCILLMLRERDELIVVNDGSTDNSAFVLANLASNDARLKILTTEAVGLVAALNLGIDKAKNPWIARFDVDDEYAPERINLQRQLIKDNVAAIFSDYSFISSTGFWLGTVPSAITSNAITLSLVNGQRTPHPIALMNRTMVLSVGGYKVEDFPAEDLGLWFRLAEKGKFLAVPKPLLSYRLSGGSISSSNRREQLAKKDQLISEFQSWQALTESCIQEFPNTVSCYLGQQKSTSRIILHLQDILKAARFSGIKVLVIKLTFTLPFLTLIKIPFVLIDISAKTIARRVYRLVKNFL